ncbi:MAG: type II toxin-antitoxin system RelE/ParE family toxin [Desulfuromonas sp.]|nr:type II toxin-antitoxin system RelE/ParE family toxin [Desulfuromonas sp.]
MEAFSLTGTAKNDLKDIARYTQKRWGRDQRNNYLKMLDDSFHLLARNPIIGRDCRDIKDGYRSFPTGNHVIFYHKTSKTQIEIVRVLHEVMDIDTHLSNIGYNQ